MSPAARLQWMKRLALVSVGMTIVLMALGAWVKANGAGLSCPDWPQCYGAWLPPFPSADNGGTWDLDGDGVAEPVAFTQAEILYEWTHRLVVSLLAVPLVAATVLAFVAKDAHPVARKLPVAALLIYVSQAFLGAITVVTGNPPWATTMHLVMATVLLTTVVVSATWVHLRPLADRAQADPAAEPAKPRVVSYVYPDATAPTPEHEG